MTSLSNRRRIRNELLVRSTNEKTKEAIKKYYAPVKGVTELPMDFTCECANIHCRKKLKLTIKDYEKLHARADRFVVYKGHEEPKIEKIVGHLGEKNLVEKFALSPRR